MFAPMFGHEFNGVIEGEGRLIDPLGGEGIEGIGNRGDSSFYRDRLPFSLRGYPLPSQRSWWVQAIDAATLRISASDPLRIR